MSAPWSESMTPFGPPTAANPTIKQLMYAAVVTGVWSGLICLVIYLIGRLAGVPFVVAARSVDVQAQVPWSVVLLVPIAFAVGGTLLASLVRGWRQAGRLVFWVGTLVALGSMVVPLTQPADVGYATRILLAIMHIVTWFLVVPQIARIIGDSEPGMSVDRAE